MRRAAYGALFALWLSTMGWLTPVGDSLAAFRIDLLVICLVLLAGLLWYRATWLAAVTALSLLLTGWPVAKLAIVPTVAAPDITLHQHNLLFARDGLPEYTRHVLANKPDVITVQEIAGNRDYLVQALSAEYPNLQLCSYKNSLQAGSVGVMIRDIGTVIDSGCAEKTELAWITMETETDLVTFASLHLFWPWPRPQAEQLAFLDPTFQKLAQPIVIGGDFNNTPWSHVVTDIAASSRTKVAHGLQPTFSLFWGWPRLRIDHVLIPNGAQADMQRLPKLGSDHNGLHARITLSD